MSMFRDCYSQRSQLVSLLCPCSGTATAKGASWSVYCVHVQGLLQGLLLWLKTAIVKPLLKKPSLDKNLLKNYRPISNLPFLSKILEKVVLHKLLSHLQENNLSNPFQSAYRAGCSTETVLLRIVNDILSALDNDNISVLLLLDLSAAFDALDHQILLSRLNSVFGIQSTALQWFHSQTGTSPLQSITRLRHHHSSCTVCLRAQYWGPFSSSCTLRLSPIS